MVAAAACAKAGCLTSSFTDNKVLSTRMLSAQIMKSYSKAYSSAVGRHCSYDDEDEVHHAEVEAAISRLS